MGKIKSFSRADDKNAAVTYYFNYLTGVHNIFMIYRIQNHLIRLEPETFSRDGTHSTLRIWNRRSLRSVPYCNKRMTPMCFAFLDLDSVMLMLTSEIIISKSLEKMKNL